MPKLSSYLALGLMSGTSLDGVDLALCSFELKYKRWSFKILSATTLPYSEDLTIRLRDCINFKNEEIDRLDKDLGNFYAESIINFLSKQDKKPDIIASHGHTVFHHPEEGITLQIGNGEIIAELTGITVVNDFRSLDISLKGQGAPLVAIGDRDLFFEFEPCLNLGGFANLSYTDTQENQMIACDISPCNLALNHLSQKIGQPYDSNGLLASGGDIDSTLLSTLNKLKYYSKNAPKSLGKEWFTDNFLPIIDSSEVNIFDVLATTTEHIAMQIAEYICDIKHPDSLLLITGGGAYNSFLVERIKNHCDINMFIPREEIVDYKEALIFAYLGVLRIRNEINVLSSVTGGEKDSSSGTIHNPK